ncbi:MAG: hypothetical protein HY650_02795, partial [Acidobacteria bacterium]|nr:hypothetical protein [Acidobacteriota bacterium]
MLNKRILFVALFLFLVVVSVRNAAAQTFSITFNATTLTAQDFSILPVGSGSSGSGSTSIITTLSLLPGTYTFRAPGNSEIFFLFTVTNSGTVDYDSALDGFVSGRGNSTLAVSGFPITFDARTLTSADFSIISESFFSGLASAVTTLRLLPGLYTFKAPGNSEIFFFFTVTNSGTVDFDSALDGFVGGRGSSTLAVSG